MKQKESLTPCDGYVSQPQSPDISDVSRRLTAIEDKHFFFLVLRIKSGCIHAQMVMKHRTQLDTYN